MCQMARCGNAPRLVDSGTMDFERYKAMRRVPQKAAQWLLMRDARAYLRMQFLYAALDSGALRALRTPRTAEDLARELGITRPDILGALLRMGVTLGELAVRGGRYRLAGRRARALVTDEGDALAAMIDEYADYHASVYQRLAERMRGAPPGEYLGEHASVIARSSRMLEPFLGAYAAATVRDGGPLRMLEIGCGSGIYLRYAAEANRAVTGVAVEMQPVVAEQARANLAAWGIGDRFRVLLGDAREVGAAAGGPFDLVTMHNNIYYFDEAEWPALFERVRGWLAPGGRYVLTTFMQGDTPAALDFDIALRCTVGCAPLPETQTLAARLRANGFGRVETARLMPLEPLYGMVAQT